MKPTTRRKDQYKLIILTVLSQRPQNPLDMPLICDVLDGDESKFIDAMGELIKSGAIGFSHFRGQSPRLRRRNFIAAGI